MVDLSAAEVRARLFEALAPLLAHVAEAARNRCDPSTLRFLIQAHPMVLKVIQVPDEGRPARVIVEIFPSDMDDKGVALASAVEALEAAVLASMPEASAMAVVLNSAVAGGGGLAVLCDANDSSAILFFAEAGKSMHEGTVLGTLGDDVETTH